MAALQRGPLPHALRHLRDDPAGILPVWPARAGRAPAYFMAAVLEVRDLRKSFGGIGAVNGVSFAVHAGEILGLIGPNGSGKSTLFNCILGQLAPSSGEVRIDGRPIGGMRPCDLNRLGIGRTFQLLQVFPQLSVRENLRSEEHTSELQSLAYLVCRLLLEKKK